MHRRHRLINIPTEIVRTLVVIAETGSFSKAGDKLGLSQPAISAQMKRLQVLTGGAVFDRVAGGVNLTARGQMVLAHARKLLEANDQILSMGGALQDTPHVRLGLSTLFAEEFLALWKDARLDIPLSFHCDHSNELARGLTEGYVDVACLVDPPSDSVELMASWYEEYVWVRSRDMLVRPGAPIPLITWPGNVLDSPPIRALENAGLAYRVVFSSPDRSARMAAAAAGIGLMGLPARQIVPQLVVANDYYLPRLEPLRAGIAVRRGVKTDQARRLTHLLSGLAPLEEATKSA